jgi:hypothetical protein
MGFMKPKVPKTKPPEPTILSPQPFNPNPAQATRPMSATGGSADSRIGTLVGGTTQFMQGLGRSPDERRRRTLIGG